MNAAISLCSFCEMHGPKIIFTTQTYKSNDDNNHEKLKFYGPKEIFSQTSSSQSEVQQECGGCYSLGDLKYLSNEHETRTSFLSAQQSLLIDIDNLLRHACIRSLSCEVHPGKEGVCYFGDDNRGHVLSHTFTLKDAQARGFRRWCSFIVFMRDKQFLLNMWPFLVDNLREVIRELQDYAERNYNIEEAQCPQRAVRLSNANNGPSSQNNSNKHPRALSTITNEKHVFVRIHMWLVWILSAGARHFVEVLPFSLLDDKMNFNVRDHIGDSIGYMLFNAKLPVTLNLDLDVPQIDEVSNMCPTSILRNLRKVLGRNQFRQILFSVLTGIQILVRGPKLPTLKSLYSLCSLVPKACRRVQTQSDQYLDSRICNFIGVDTTVAVPLPCTDICRLDIIPPEHITENSQSHVIKWTGNLPPKLPTLLIKMEKSIENENLTDSVLRSHFAALQEEWANIAKVLHAMRGRGCRGDLPGLMMSLGAGPQDQKLLDVWSMGLPSNPA